MVQGLSEFERRWKAIPDKVRMEVRYQMAKIADEIVEEMYVRAPQRTGDMAGSIRWTWGDAPKGSAVIGQVGSDSSGPPDAKSLRITIYAGDRDTFYARFQEFGTKNMPANPFFFPVWRAKRRSVQSRITRAINRGIKV